MKLYNYLMENDVGCVEMDKSFKDLTTIGCGGKIAYYVCPNNIDQLARLYKYLNENNIRYFIIGNGSNVLAHDELFNGVVISLKDMSRIFKIENNILTCSANYNTISLAYSLAIKGKGDLSYLGGIPGTLGGAIYNNSGAYNKSIKDNLIEVKYLDTAGNIRILKNEELDFGYRHSIFHSIRGIILEAKLKLIDMDTKDILLTRKKRRIESQPLDKKSMGSIFKNPPLIPSYQIIDFLNLRGYAINDAQISEKHANFIINNGNAKCYEIIKLIEIIRKKSYNEIGIDLDYEITII